jgi:hypothetical protein
MALWPPILLRRCVVGVASRLPTRWFTEAKGAVRTTATLVWNHLECPKSIRNGACGAPTATGLCGELTKYGVRKPCVFVARNARDRRGAELAARLTARAKRLRGSAFAWMLELAAAVVDRRALSLRIVPGVDERVPGASAIVSALAGRFPGATLVGSRVRLPASAARSRITLDARTARGAAPVRAALSRLAGSGRSVRDRVRTLETILEALAAANDERAAPIAVGEGSSTYERMLTHRAHHAMTSQERPPRAP